MPLSDISGQAYTDLINGQLTEERASKSSLEQRGTAVITSAGTLVTLLLALTALVTTSKTFELTAIPRYFLGASALLFVFAALAGIYINWPRTYLEAKTKDIGKLISDPKEWTEKYEVGSQDTALVSLSILEDSRTVNGKKATGLKVAMGLEAAAIGALAVAAVLVLSPVGSPNQSALIELTTSTETFCGTLVSGNNGQVTIDDQFRHSVQTISDSDIRTQRIGVQDCTK